MAVLALARRPPTLFELRRGLAVALAKAELRASLGPRALPILLRSHLRQHFDSANRHLVRPNIRGVDLDAYRLADEIDGQNQSRVSTLAHQAAEHAFERPANDFNHLPFAD